MLEGKELEGKVKIGGKEVGQYGVDISEDGTLKADVDAALDVPFAGGNAGIKLSIYGNVDLMALLKKGASKLPLLGKIFEDKKVEG
jgi:hypothetical protein